jgi:hypothetical protein
VPGSPVAASIGDRCVAQAAAAETPSHAAGGNKADDNAVRLCAGRPGVPWVDSSTTRTSARGRGRDADL